MRIKCWLTAHLHRFAERENDCALQRLAGVEHPQGVLEHHVELLQLPHRGRRQQSSSSWSGRRAAGGTGVSNESNTATDRKGTWEECQSNMPCDVEVVVVCVCVCVNRVRPVYLYISNALIKHTHLCKIRIVLIERAQLCKISIVLIKHAHLCKNKHCVNETNPSVKKLAMY